MIGQTPKKGEAIQVHCQVCTLKIKYFYAVATACMLSLSAVPAMAAEAVPAPEDQTAGLTVSYVSEDIEAGTKTPISGATFEVTKVAYLNWHGGSPEYVLEDEFMGTGVDFNGMTASESREAAKNFSMMNTEALDSAVTDSNGKAVFDGLDHGIYLVEEVAKEGVAAEYSTAEAYLVMAPSYQDGQWIYSVVSSPKTAPDKIFVPTPPEEDEPEEVIPPDGPADNVQTGDTMNIYLWMGLAVCALSALTILSYVRKTHRKEEPKDA